MAQVLRMEDSVQCSIAELRRIENARQTEERVERKRKQEEEARLRAEQERLRAEEARLQAWEQEMRATSARQAEDLARLGAERVALVERIARTEETVRLGEQRLRLELERIVAQRESTQMTSVAHRRKLLPGIVLSLVVLAQGYLVGAHIQNGHRQEVMAAEIDSAAGKLERVQADVETLAGDVRAVSDAQKASEQRRAEPAAEVGAGTKQGKPAKRTHGNRQRGSKGTPATKGGGSILKNCDVRSPLC